MNTFLVSKILGNLGTNVYSFAISMYILSITGSSLTFATNLFLSVLPRTIISPFVGVLGDRLPRKWLVLGGQLGQGLTIFVLLLYTIYFQISIPAIFIATIFNSLFNAFSSISFTASISNLVDNERIQRAMSFNQFSLAISGILGPVVGGILYGFCSIDTFLLIYIISSILTFVLESTMNFELYKGERIEKSNNNSMLGDFKEGLHYLKQQKIIRTVIFAILWVNLFLSSVNVGNNYVFITIFHMEPKNIGLIEGGLAIGMLLASIFFASKMKVNLPLIWAKVAIIGCGAVVILSSLPLLIKLSDGMNFLYFFVMMLFFGAFVVSVNTPLGVLLQFLIEEEYRARVFSILEMLSMSLMPIGTIVYGVLFDIVPAQYIFLISGGLVVITALSLIRREIINLAHPEI